jgi:hypothetical protein
MAPLPYPRRIALIVLQAMFVSAPLAAASPAAHTGGTAASEAGSPGQGGSGAITMSNAPAPSRLTAPDSQWPEAETVNDLMQAEMRAAMMLQKQRAGARALMAGANSDAHEDSRDRLDLAAIYGIGDRLHVEVVVNGKPRQYRHGKKWPDGGAEGEDAYALVAIDGTCVKLGGANGTRTACMDGRAAGSVR